MLIRITLSVTALMTIIIGRHAILHWTELLNRFSLSVRVLSKIEKLFGVRVRGSAPGFEFSKLLEGFGLARKCVMCHRFSFVVAVSKPIFISCSSK